MFAMQNEIFLPEQNPPVADISREGLSSNPIIKYFQIEGRQFKRLSIACRRLIISNFLYVLIMTCIQLVSSAYVYRQKEGDVLYNMVYWFGYYGGTTFGFFVTGILLRYVKVNYLYAVGIMLNACSFVPLLFIGNPSAAQLVFTGFAVGIGNGMYWSNRHYMTILSTHNLERNYYGGIDSSLFTVAQIISPILFGILVSTNSLAAGANLGQYKILFMVLVALFVLAAINIAKGKYQTIPLKKFFFIKYGKAWNRQRAVNILEGIAEGGLFTIPPILILQLVGKEGALGTIDSVSVALSTIPVYLMGRYAKPKHRIYVLAISLVALLIGASILAASFNKTGTTLFYGFVKLAYILNAFMYATIRLRSVDVGKQQEGRDEYAYIFDSELFTEAGRLLTIVFFCIIYFKFSATIALQYVLLLVSLIQLFALPFVRKMKQD
jgi:MFS transporter, YQGE family, putative transporter